MCVRVQTHFCFPMGLEGTFALYKFLALWWGTFIVLKNEKLFT